MEAGRLLMIGIEKENDDGGGTITSECSAVGVISGSGRILCSEPEDAPLETARRPRSTEKNLSGK